MTRTFRLMAVFLATLATTSMVIPTSAEAATKEETKMAKTHLKDVAKQVKTFKKLRAKWTKSTEKGKDTAKIEADIHAIVKSELDELRKDGISSKGDGTEEGTDTWKERYRNVLVNVKNAKAEGRWANQMESLEEYMDTRLTRAEKYLTQMGG